MKFQSAFGTPVLAALAVSWVPSAASAQVLFDGVDQGPDAVLDTVLGSGVEVGDGGTLQVLAG